MFSSLVTALGLITATNALPVRQGGDLYYEGATWNAKGVSHLSDTHDYYFEQRLDHFDRENADTFQQRYFIFVSYLPREFCCSNNISFHVVNISDISSTPPTGRVPTPMPQCFSASVSSSVPRG